MKNLNKVKSTVFLLAGFIVSSTLFAEEGNLVVCTVSLVSSKITDMPRISSASSGITNANTSGTYGLLKVVSDTRALVYRGAIGHDAENGPYFRMQIDEVDRGDDDTVTLRNATNILPETVYYSPYAKDEASNKAQSVRTSVGDILTSCTVF